MSSTDQLLLRRRCRLGDMMTWNEKIKIKNRWAFIGVGVATQRGRRWWSVISTPKRKKMMKYQSLCGSFNPLVFFLLKLTEIYPSFFCYSSIFMCACVCERERERETEGDVWAKGMCESRGSEGRRGGGYQQMCCNWLSKISKGLIIPMIQMWNAEIFSYDFGCSPDSFQCVAVD